MAKIKISNWDTAKHLKSEKDIKYYLEAVFSDGTAEEIAYALGNIARARHAMGKIAKSANVNISSLYRSLSREGTPYFRTINHAVNSLGYQLTVIPQKKIA
ncbi:MAG: putative addiction module antidote protein [Candidatus Margulisbacteria bacterium]|jgi:probable addiction module antidote protein|nr:putative addiction module antidote protein [Candidatus Margulisiibacteriota bacterium]